MTTVEQATETRDTAIPFAPADRPDAEYDARTTVVVRRPVSRSLQARRRVRGLQRNQVLCVIGATIVSLSLTALLFGRIAPFSGLVAFIAVAYAIFLATYAVLVAQTERGPAVVDAMATVLLYTAVIGVTVAVASVGLFTIIKGAPALIHPNFYLQDLHTTSPLAPLSHGGIKHAIIGTLWTVGIALTLTVPVGFAAAVWLNEATGSFARTVRTVVNAMTALPDILAGLFIYAVLIVTLHRQKSGLAAGLALAIMALPIIIRASDVVLRLIPGGLREASLALGASRWATVRYVVLPTARPGLATAVILAAARTIGETAPILLTAGYTTYTNTDPLSGPMVSLPLVAYTLVGSGLKNQVARGFGAASVLLLLVVLLFLVARFIGGRSAGRVSERSRRRVARRSAAGARRRQRLAAKMAVPLEEQAPSAPSPSGVANTEGTHA